MTNRLKSRMCGQTTHHVPPKHLLALSWDPFSKSQENTLSWVPWLVRSYER